ncbi:hypothetical protein GCM10009860_19520 [Microbacterium mitrae]
MVKLLWLAVCDIEDKRAGERKGTRTLAVKRKASRRRIEGNVTTNRKQALEQLALAYPE